MGDMSLHELLRSYRAGETAREKILERVARMVYESPWRFGFDDEDDAADALERHGGRIASLADRFEDRGVAFDAYLRSCLRYLARTMRRERRRNAERELVCERAGAAAEAGFEPKYAAPGPRPLPCPASSPRRRVPEPERAAFASRLVFLAIKCAWEIDDAMAERVAAETGVDPAWLGSALAQARRSLEAERSRYERMVARRNASWCRLRLLEYRLRAEMSGARKRRMEEALERERLRLGRARSEIMAFKPTVPNSVVARILGVPKGTVDSGLYYLRRRAHPPARPRAAAAPPALGLESGAGERVSSAHGTALRKRQRP